jgi:prepilin-type N-terminal cleavage/methylation domain-containing protein
MRILKAGVYNDTGFTLIELSMVMLVIGIVMAIAMPRVGGMLERQQMQRTINVLRGTVRYLQARAALTKYVYRLTIDLDQHVLFICYLDLRRSEDCYPEPTRELRPYVLPAAVRIVDVVTPQGEKIREGLAQTHFHPTGFAEPSIIHLESETAQHFTIMIEPLAGRIKVYDGYVELEAS